jgi:putative transposase
VRTLLHSIFDQPDAESVVAQYDRALDALADKLPKVAEHLDAARAELLAFTAFPKQIWRQIWSNNPRIKERLNKEIRRRTDVVGIFPDRTAIIRLVGAVLAEQHDEWIEGRRYLGLDVLTRSRAVLTIPNEPATPQPATTSPSPPKPRPEGSRTSQRLRPRPKGHAVRGERRTPRAQRTPAAIWPRPKDVGVAPA